MQFLRVFDDLLNPEKVFVAFDIETTGLSPNLDKIIELGGVKYKDGKVVDRFNELINPGITIPEESIRVHGITQDMVEGKEGVEIVIPRFLNWVQEAILVAHNAKFDTGFVNKNMIKLGLGILPHKVIDTLFMAQRAYPGRKSYSLQNLAKDLGIVSLEAHRAEDDARVCIELFAKCLAELNPGGQVSLF